MRLTLEEALTRIAEKTIDNTNQLKKAVKQRRNGMEDLYGVVYSAYGDSSHAARFYISISPDLVYYERFAFKFIIKPYESTVNGLSVDGESGTYIIPGTSTIVCDSDAEGNLNYGVHQIDTLSDNWRVRIDGVDITDYLIEQHDGEWIDMTGETREVVWPSNQLDDREDFYDILDVACMLNAEGTEASREARDKLLSPRFKKVEIISDAMFSVEAVLYLKYSHSNR